MTEKIPNEEILEIWDWETGKPTGRQIERSSAHKNGIPHEGVHLWIVRHKDRAPEMLFQRRALGKETYPGYLDITVGGHVPYGLRENKIQKEAFEEIGIAPAESSLIDLGYYRYEETTRTMFHREFQRIYILKDGRPLNEYTFNDGEVSAIYAIPLAALEKILKGDASFEVEAYAGSAIFTATVSRGDFHPLLFAPSMEEYMRIVIDAVRKTGERNI